jgi:hypothetical protein
MKDTSLALPLYKYHLLIRALVGEALARIRNRWRGALQLLGVFELLGLPPRWGDTTISRRWLTRQLRRGGALAQGMELFAVEADFPKTRGWIGTIIKLTLRYADGSAGPATLIIKTSNGSLRGRHSVIANGGYREAWFYTSRLAAGSMPTPRVFYSHASRLLGETLLLMEDVTAVTDAVGVNMVMGNQIWGGAPTPHDPVEVMERVFLTAADQHAKFWRDPTLLNEGWLKGADWFRGRGRAAWEAGTDLARVGWEWAKARKDVSYNPRLIAIVGTSVVMEDGGLMTVVRTTFHDMGMTRESPGY